MLYSHYAVYGLQVVKRFNKDSLGEQTVFPLMHKAGQYLTDDLVFTVDTEKKK